MCGWPALLSASEPWSQDPVQVSVGSTLSPLHPEKWFSPHAKLLKTLGEQKWRTENPLGIAGSKKGLDGLCVFVSPPDMYVSTCLQAEAMRQRSGEVMRMRKRRTVSRKVCSKNRVEKIKEGTEEKRTRETLSPNSRNRQLTSRPMFELFVFLTI